MKALATKILKRHFCKHRRDRWLGVRSEANPSQGRIGIVSMAVQRRKRRRSSNKDDDLIEFGLTTAQNDPENNPAHLSSGTDGEGPISCGLTFPPTTNLCVAVRTRNRRRKTSEKILSFPMQVLVIHSCHKRGFRSEKNQVLWVYRFHFRDDRDPFIILVFKSSGCVLH
jgi:hypothetical protein